MAAERLLDRLGATCELIREAFDPLSDSRVTREELGDGRERLGFPADLRDYGVGAQILRDLGVRAMRIITNNPGKRAGIEGYGLKIVERVALEIKPNEKNLEYLRTQKEKLGHVLHLMS